MMLQERKRKMIILLTVGPLLALAFGLAIANDIRARRSRRRHAPGGQIDASKADSLNVTPGPGVGFGMSVSEYLPPADDGRPQH